MIKPEKAERVQKTGRKGKNTLRTGLVCYAAGSGPEVRQEVRLRHPDVQHAALRDLLLRLYGDRAALLVLPEDSLRPRRPRAAERLIGPMPA